MNGRYYLKVSSADADTISYYTIALADGSVPSETSPEYTKPLSVTAPITISARTYKTDWKESETVTGTYMVTLFQKGDITGDGVVNLTDALLALQISAGIAIDAKLIDADVNENNRIGLAEAIYILRKISGL